MTCRKSARSGQLFNGDISFKMRAQHLLGSQLLPGFQSAPWRDSELWGAAMRLQCVSAKDRGNLIKRQPIEGFPVFDWGENVSCHLRHNQIFDKKHFPELER